MQRDEQIKGLFSRKTNKTPHLKFSYKMCKLSELWKATLNHQPWQLSRSHWVTTFNWVWIYNTRTLPSDLPSRCCLCYLERITKVILSWIGSFNISWIKRMLQSRFFVIVIFWPTVRSCILFFKYPQSFLTSK